MGHGQTLGPTHEIHRNQPTQSVCRVAVQISFENVEHVKGFIVIYVPGATEKASFRSRDRSHWGIMGLKLNVMGSCLSDIAKDILHYC